MTSLIAVSEEFGGTAPHRLTELYDKAFAGGGTAPATGPINLRLFTGKSWLTPIPPTYGTTNIKSTISPSPLTYTSTNTAYTLNIAGPNGPQAEDTPQPDVRGIDVHPDDQVTMIVHDSAYSTSSQLRFFGNYLRRLRNSVNRSENDTFNSRYKPSEDYDYETAIGVNPAEPDVVSWYIPIPRTVTQIDFYYVKTTGWMGFSITIE